MSLPRRPTPRRRLGAALVALMIVGLPVVALAQATVSVRVRAANRVVEGRVTLVPQAGGRTYGCSTREGACTIRDVPGGRYKVRFAPSRGEAPPERTVMIPPAGEVDLIVSGDGG